MQRLQHAGLRTQKTKCTWLQDEITFLGHRIDKDGVHPTNKRIKRIRALQGMKAPTDSTELRSFLGSITYYGRFIENLHVKCIPLYRLLKKNIPFVWTPEDDKIFNELTQILTTNDTLVHYDPQ
ncbi:hypothetical protein QE152_g13609 [Popillia japonica]|uniref:RNA-directed DNA polymerase n=1 Tax=Popillia japonica TaxID=7064 RepID=A0AAW1LC26_POPJA